MFFIFFIFLFSYTCLRKKQFLSRSRCIVVTVARIVVKGVLIFIATIATSISARVVFLRVRSLYRNRIFLSVFEKKKKPILSNIVILVLSRFNLLEISLIRITVSFSHDASEIIRKLLVKGNCKVNCLLVPRDSWSTVSRMFA